jgi:MoxR-like ATPase
VSDAATVRRLIAITHAVYAADAVKEYVVNLVRATRTSPTCGSAPRRARRCTCCGRPRRTPR